MGLGRQGEHQGKLFLAFDEIPRSRGYSFYDRLQQILRQFLQLASDHFSLNRMWARLLLSVHEAQVRKILAKKSGLVQGGRIGVDASTMEANAVLRTTVRRDTGESYRQRLTRLAKESGIEGSHGGKSGSAGPLAQRQIPFEQGLAFACRQEEGRPDASGLQAGTCSGSGQRRGGCRRDSRSQSG